MKTSPERFGKWSNHRFFLPLLAGFILSYFLFFFLPTFCNSKHEMLVPVKYVSAMNPIGNDLKMVLDSCRDFLNHKIDDGSGTRRSLAFISPLGFIFFAPFLLIDFFFAYKIYITLILLVYLAIMTYLPYRICGNHSFSKVMILFLITGLASYGFHFEVERAQCSIFAVAFCLTGIYLFHFKPKLTPWAYACFVMGTQLKIVPGIFILMFVRDWRDWRGNLKRFALLGACNLAALLIFGFNTFGAFFRTLQQASSKPYFWIGNHSIKGFVAVVRDWPWHYQLDWLLNYSWLTEKILLGTFMFCLGAVIYMAWRKRLTGFNPFLLIICIIGMMLIPSESMDYRLSTLGPCVLIFLVSLESGYVTNFPNYGSLRSLLVLVLLFLFGFSYSSSLYSHTLKLPEVYDRMNFGLIFSWLTASAMPSLLLLAILTTLLMAVMTYRESTSAIEDAEKSEETGTTGSRKMTRGIDSSNRKGKQALVSVREAKS